MDVTAHKHIAVTVGRRRRVVVAPVAYQRQRGDRRRNLLAGFVRCRQRFLEGGKVALQRECQVERALIDLWQADAEGVYDNTGFRLRGHQFTDAEGRYRFLTIMPASYEGRTRHFHVKVQAPGGRVLTTQLYFPGEAHNRSDRLFRRELLMNVTEAEGSLAARFDFVLDVR
jgi:protocatechuate 3,4-dioxygenase beta subunit